MSEQVLYTGRKSFGTCVIRSAEGNATAEYASHMHDAAKITRLINNQIKNFRTTRKPATAARDWLVGTRAPVEVSTPRVLGIAVTILLGSMFLNVARADVEIVAETGVQAPGEAQADRQVAQPPPHHARHQPAPRSLPDDDPPRH